MGKETNKILPITTDIKLLIDQSRQNVAYTVNAEITLLYWKVGRRINEEILKNDRAEYGKQIIESISQQLTHYYGSGWSKRQLTIVSALRRYFLKLKLCTHCVHN